MKWQFWRWRPKVSLCTFQILALFIGSLVLVYQRSTPWRAGLTLKASAYGVSSVSFSGDSKKLLAGGSDGFARVWDVDSGTESATIDLVHPALSSELQQVLNAKALPVDENISRRITASEISPDGRKVVVTDDSGALTVFDANNGQEILAERLTNTVTSVHFSADGSKIIAADPASNLSRFGGMVYIVESISVFYNSESFEVPSDALCSAFFSKDGKKIVTATTDGLVQVWNRKNTTPIAALRGDTQFFRSAVFSPDGKFIATSGKDCTVRLWTAYTGDVSRSIIDFDKDAAPTSANGGHTWFAKPVAVMRGHNQYVLSSQFSPEGDRLATISLDGSVRIWGGRDGAALFTLTQKGPWRSVAFAPDGNSLALAGNDGSVQLWNLRCSERWYGKLTLPEFWVMILLIPALIWSLRRDQRIIPPTPAA